MIITGSGAATAATHPGKAHTGARHDSREKLDEGRMLTPACDISATRADYFFGRT